MKYTAFELCKQMSKISKCQLYHITVFTTFVQEWVGSICYSSDRVSGFLFFRSGFESIDFLFMSTNFSFSHKLDMESGLYGSNPVLLLLHHFCNNLCPVEISDILAWNYVWIFSHIFQNFFDEIYKPLFCLLHM